MLYSIHTGVLYSIHTGVLYSIHTGVLYSIHTGVLYSIITDLHRTRTGTRTGTQLVLCERRDGQDELQVLVVS